MAVLVETDDLWRAVPVFDAFDLEIEVVSADGGDANKADRLLPEIPKHSN
jgi:hypothetical protein